MDFPDDLDDACQLTHAQAIHYCYSVEAMDLRFKKSILRRFATSPKAEAAAAALVKAGAWIDHGREYEIAHHEAVVRQSLGYQLRERARARKKMQAKRSGEDPGPVTPDVTRDVTQGVTRNDVRTQTDRHTDRQRSEASPSSNDPDDPAEDIDRATGEIRSAWPAPPLAPMTCTAPGCTEQLRTTQRRRSGVCYAHYCEREGIVS